MPNLQSNSELFQFKIGLSGTFWKKRPQFTIGVNDQILVRGQIEGDSNQIQFIEFSAELANEGEHALKIRLENKDDSDVVQNEDKSAIIQDMLLNIESIVIDDIVLDNLRWQHSEFHGDDLSRPVIPRCVNLGWNGTYIFKFTCPFYEWLFKNM